MMGAVTARPVSLSIDHGASVLTEQRRVGPPAFDFQDRYPAAAIDPATQVAVAVVAEFRIGATPLLWFTADRTAAVVDAAVLSDLVVADVTAMGPGAVATIGQLTERGRGQLPGRDLVTFLLRARAIATYVHIGAELCLFDERTDASGYQVRITGEHTYFTNQRHVVALEFEVTIDPTGVISVRIAAR